MPERPRGQARRCFEIIEAALAEAGATPADVVRTRMFLTSVDDADAVSAVHGELFGATRPAATMVVVAALVVPAWKVEIEAEAVLPGGDADEERHSGGVARGLRRRRRD